MAISRQRLPSRRDAVLLFHALNAIVQTYAMVRLIYLTQAWLLRMDTFVIIGAYAYSLVYAFLESLVLSLIFASFAIVLPARLLREALPAKAGLGLLSFGAWLGWRGAGQRWRGAWLGFGHDSGTGTSGLIGVLFRAVGQLQPSNILLWGPLLLAGIIYLSFCFIRRWQKRMLGLIERAEVLSVLYIVLDCISLFVIVTRNVFG